MAYLNAYNYLKLNLTKSITRFLILFAFLGTPLKSIAQIVPDNSLGAQSAVIQNSAPNIQLIGGGALRGSNLLQSFSQLNVNNGSAAYFVDPGVANIVARVTGSNQSTILGLLGVKGNANLFLINPQGFLFGPNAKLNVNRALTISTGNSLEFSSGYIFDTLNTNNLPSINIGNPSAINYNGNSSASIQVYGTGQNLFQAGNIFSPVTGFGQSTSGLIFSPGKQVSLLGGSILFNGGIITAPSGNVTIAAIDQGKINLNNISGLLTFDYSNVAGFKDIALTNQSLIDTSGLGYGTTTYLEEILPF